MVLRLIVRGIIQYQVSVPNSIGVANNTSITLISFVECHSLVSSFRVDVLSLSFLFTTQSVFRTACCNAHSFSSSVSAWLFSSLRSLLNPLPRLQFTPSHTMREKASEVVRL